MPGDKHTQAANASRGPVKEAAPRSGAMAAIAPGPSWHAAEAHGMPNESGGKRVQAHHSETEASCAAHGERSASGMVATALASAEESHNVPDTQRPPTLASGRVDFPVCHCYTPGNSYPREEKENTAPPS
eukprot:scpid105053/ scgid24508/ 